MVGHFHYHDDYRAFHNFLSRIEWKSRSGRIVDLLRVVTLAAVSRPPGTSGPHGPSAAVAVPATTSAGSSLVPGTATALQLVPSQEETKASFCHRRKLLDHSPVSTPFGTTPGQVTKQPVSRIRRACHRWSSLKAARLLTSLTSRTPRHPNKM